MTMTRVDNLRLHLTFFDELKQVQVMGARNRFGLSLCKLGLISGKDALQEALERAGVDHYITCTGDLSLGTFKATYYELSPKRIVETLERGFRKAQELESKFLDGVELTDEEKQFAVPNTLWLYSSSVQTEDGLKRVHDWFRERGLEAKPSVQASRA